VSRGQPLDCPGCQQFTGIFDFVYRCDCCHGKVFRRQGEQIVFCSRSCRCAFRKGRRRLLRRHPSLRRWWNREENGFEDDEKSDGHAVGGS